MMIKDVIPVILDYIVWYDTISYYIILYQIYMYLYYILHDFCVACWSVFPLFYVSLTCFPCYFDFDVCLVTKLKHQNSKQLNWNDTWNATNHIESLYFSISKLFPWLAVFDHRHHSVAFSQDIITCLLNLNFCERFSVMVTGQPSESKRWVRLGGRGKNKVCVV